MPADKKKKKKPKREKPPGTSVVDENTEPNDIVEALLREFMYRKGLGNILEAFDVARPRGDKTINSVKAIYVALQLQDIYKRMREEDKGVSVFEVLVAHSFKAPGGEDDAESKNNDSDSSAKVEELQSKLEESAAENKRLADSLRELEAKVKAQQQELEELRKNAPSSPSTPSNAGNEGGVQTTPSRFGLLGLPSLAGQRKDPIEGAVIIGKGLLKTKDAATKSNGSKKSVRFHENDEWLKVDDALAASSVRSCVHATCVCRFCCASL